MSFTLDDLYAEEPDQALPTTIPGGVGGSPGPGPKKDLPVGPYLGMEDLYPQMVEKGAEEVEALKKEGGSGIWDMGMVDQFLEGVQGYRTSADRSLEYMFGADEPRQAELRQQAMQSQLAEERMPPAFQVGREILPWVVPASRAAKLPAQMLEAAGTSMGLDLLDFNKQPTTGSMTGNAFGAAMAPMAFRGMSKLSPVGTPGQITKEAIAGSNPARAHRLKRVEGAGYQLTPAEVTGSDNLRRTERQSLKNRRRGPGAKEVFSKLEEHNKGVSNRVVMDALDMPQGMSSITEDALGAAHKRIKAGLDDIVEGTPMKFDEQFNLDINKIRGEFGDPKLRELAGIDPEAKAVVDKWAKQAPINRKFEATDWQNLIEAEKRASRDAYHSGKSDLGNTHLAVAEALEDLATRHMKPGKVDEFNALKKKYAVSEMIAGDKYRDIVDVDGNVNPDKVKQALERKSEVRKRLNRGESYSDLDVIRDYAKLRQPRDVMPLEGSKGLVEDVINIVPKLGGGTIPAWLYLKAGARMPFDPARKAAAGRMGSYMGGRAGGTDMESSIWNALTQGTKSGGLDVLPAIQQGATSATKSLVEAITGGGTPFWGP